MRKFFVISVIFCILFISCKSTPIVLVDELTAPQIIQLGYEAYNRQDFLNAERCYNEVINRFGDELAYYVEARYELGRLALQKKNYEKAEASFQEIIDLYVNNEIGTIPPAYRKLSEISLSQIPAPSERKTKTRK